MNIFPQSQEVKVYRQGECKTYICSEQEYDEVVAQWNAMTASAHVMPAYGVSLDWHTVKALEGGVWVEFCYSSQNQFNGMPFERLLIEVKPQYCGFNVIRYNSEGGYSGRCYYIDLNGGNMSAFYNSLCE